MASLVNYVAMVAETPLSLCCISYIYIYVLQNSLDFDVKIMFLEDF